MVPGADDYDLIRTLRQPPPAAVADGVPCGACGRVLPPTTAETVKCRCGRANRVFRFRPVRRWRAARPLVAGAPCAYHAGNAAVISCPRCGSFLCDLCATPVAEATYCTACFERLRASGELPGLQARFARPHLLALLLATPSIVPFAIVATLPAVAWFGVKAVRARREIALRESGLTVHLVMAALLLLLGGVLTYSFVQGQRG